MKRFKDYIIEQDVKVIEAKAEAIFQQSLKDFDYYKKILKDFPDYNGKQAYDATDKIMDHLRTKYESENKKDWFPVIYSLIFTKVFSSLT